VLAITPESDGPPLKTRGRRIAASELPTAPLEHLDAVSVDDLHTPAYLLFTSGTTGVPKGVPISHSNLLSYLQAIQQIVPVSSEDRLLQAADLTFDLSVHDMFQTWTRGAELCVVPDNAAILIPRLVAQLEVTALLIVPSVAARAARQGLLKPAGMPSLRHSLFLGEALPVATAETWQAAAPNSALINTYGPTEATILISAYRVDPVKRLNMAVVPIGWPIGEERMQVFALDGRPAAENETGEVYLAGTQLTRGYWRAPEIDADKFVTIDGVRWYKSGDVGTYSGEHGILFKGRADRQIKIRGYRVELQEIEGAVRKIVGHDQVAVVPWPLQPGGTADGCVAFVAGQPTDAKAIIFACGQSLPFYATPDRILYVDELPLNPNSKIDYNVLAKDPRLLDP
jgi:amino acid adenylation domain-containing protein